MLAGVASLSPRPPNSQPRISHNGQASPAARWMLRHNFYLEFIFVNGHLLCVAARDTLTMQLPLSLGCSSSDCVVALQAAGRVSGSLAICVDVRPSSAPSSALSPVDSNPRFLVISTNGFFCDVFAHFLSALQLPLSDNTHANARASATEGSFVPRAEAIDSLLSFGCEGVFGFEDANLCALVTGDGIVILSQLLQVEPHSASSSALAPASASASALSDCVIDISPLENHHHVIITHMARSSSSYKLAAHIRHAQSATSSACVLTIPCFSSSSGAFPVSHLETCHHLIDASHYQPFPSHAFLSILPSGNMAVMSDFNSEAIQVIHLHIRNQSRSIICCRCMIVFFLLDHRGFLRED